MTAGPAASCSGNVANEPEAMKGDATGGVLGSLLASMRSSRVMWPGSGYPSEDVDIYVDRGDLRSQKLSRSSLVCIDSGGAKFVDDLFDRNDCEDRVDSNVSDRDLVRAGLVVHPVEEGLEALYDVRRWLSRLDVACAE